jgi:hypothetical protein
MFVGNLPLENFCFVYISISIWGSIREIDSIYSVSYLQILPKGQCHQGYIGNSVSYFYI